ncbi:FAD-dependent oxidoreductase [Aerolutibacter ruishenii]|uniref:NAD/ferredoxin-dependent reductase-like protein n=1 Tax=Aerolutibacter ruishenii TaxID=686800 RepID=A0A562LI77_9GAMM|nr:FAD-dependent oxidoreductase [Lysobacter ruishenii]TWI07307.1 NAD/ferredoxin-dependent reductase-like protein [Lysobacter ruishenii]
MAQTDSPPSGPDFTLGVPLVDIPEAGVLAGHVDGEPVLLARLDDGLHAVGGRCTHYGGPLAEGRVSDGEVRCPWHHACFSLRTGAALHAPAFAGLPVWRVEVKGEMAYVRGGPVQEPPVAAPLRAATRDDAPRALPRRIAIIGGGAAGYAAALQLRARGFDGDVTLFSDDAVAPYDRPNLSKDYLAGTAPEEWIPLQDTAFYADHGIDLRVGCAVGAINVINREVLTADGARSGYDALLLATGAEPRRLPLPGFDRPNVFVLRSLADARAIIAASDGARSVTLLGAGFIGMEAAAALRARGLAVHMVAPEAVPMARALGDEVGSFVTGLHREQGVVFHLQANAVGYDGHALTLGNGEQVPADVLIVGAGVVPRAQLAEAAGMAIQGGVLVDARLETSIAHHYAAGDVARYPYRGELIRVEHWVHAQRQGQAVAANLLGECAPFNDVPFFWTHHYGVELRYVGHATEWDQVQVDGTLAGRDFTARYLRNGALVAAASVGRDLENLALEAELREAITHEAA